MKKSIEHVLNEKKIKISDAQDMLRKILAGKKVVGKEKESIDIFIKILELDETLPKEAAQVLLPFADPTFDTTFKMLFGSKEHDDILINLLNNLLNFSGNKKITALEIITEKLQTPVFSYIQAESSVTGAVDVLCTTTSGQKIAVEMQRAKQPYFLARTQHYMSKLISAQVKEQEGKEYHKEILDTYILVLEKQNLFTGQHELSNKIMYEIDAEPMIKQTKEPFPGNKMHWKFFELSKFKEHNDSSNLTKNSNLKQQWLEFLINCGDQLEEPDRHEIIKKGYNIMKMMQWEGDKQALYWKEQTREFDAIENQKEEKEKAYQEGKLKGEIKGEIKKIKDFIDLKIPQEKYIDKLQFLKQENIAYIEEHFNDNESQIMGGMEIEYQNDIL